MNEASVNGDIGQWLKERCQKEVLSLREAGQKANLSHSTIRDIINGTCIPSPATVGKLASAFSNGDHGGEALKRKLLILAGHINGQEGTGVSEPLAQLLDIIDGFSEARLKVMARFADFLADTEAGK